MGAHSCPASTAANTTSEIVRGSRALRLSRLGVLKLVSAGLYMISSISTVTTLAKNNDEDADADADADEVSGT